MSPPDGHDLRDRLTVLPSHTSQTGSEWTLDYPPFFAYFERFLASFAYLVDPKIVQLDNLEYGAWTAVAFQRTSVIVSELVLAGALLK